jgi:hypothetical protein
VVLEQVTNGIAVRMALLYLAISGDADDSAPPEPPPPHNRRATDRKPS